MTQKMKTSELFAACIPLIKGGRIGYICHALFFLEYGDEWAEKWIENDREAPGVDIIMDRLNGSEHLRSTITDIRDGFADILGVKDWYVHPDSGYINTNTFRIMWLESLVAEFQQLGD